MKITSLKEKMAWKGLKSIEFRVFGWIWQAAVILAFLGYLGMNLTGLWLWVQVKWVRAQDISELSAVLQQGVASGDFNRAEQWISFRPFPDSSIILQTATPYTGRFSPLIFFNFAKRAAWMGNAEQVKFWNSLGYYRLRYDTLRCGMPDSVEIMGSFIKALSLLDTTVRTKTSLEEEIRLARKVLAFDTQYPAQNNPKKICSILNTIKHGNFAPAPPENWEKIRFSLRYVTDISLTYEEKKLKDKKKTSVPQKAQKK
jgi:hypothetical protein